MVIKLFCSQSPYTHTKKTHGTPNYRNANFYQATTRKKKKLKNIDVSLIIIRIPCCIYLL